MPFETLRPGMKSLKYSLSNAVEGETWSPTASHDIIYIEPLSNMNIENRSPKKFTSTVIEAVKLYRPEIKDIHAIHCRAEFDRNRQRTYRRSQ